MTTDALLADTDIEDALAQAYVAAVAAKAGYVTSIKNFDRDGIDISFEAGGQMRPRVDAQLKATINLSEIGTAKDRFSYQCPKRNYDLLRLPTQTPRILVVLRLPKDKSAWLHEQDDALTLRHCAYWASLAGKDELTSDKASCAVHLPKLQRFDAATLKTLMAKSRTGDAL